MAKTVTFKGYTLDVKKIIILSLFLVTLSSFISFKVDNFDFHHLFGRCEGSKYCQICKNCTRCGYCKSGGTCGVCSTPISAGRRSTVKTNASQKSIASDRLHSIRTTSSQKSSSLGKAPKKYSESASDNLRIKQQVSKVESKTVNTLKDNGIDKVNEKPSSYNLGATKDIVGSKNNLFNIDIPENSEFVRITAENANLRQRVGTKSLILQKLNHGDLLIKLNTINGWVKVQALDSGEIGYVFGALLK